LEHGRETDWRSVRPGEGQVKGKVSEKNSSKGLRRKTRHIWAKKSEGKYIHQ